MASDAIRDVLIRVSIQNGNLMLGPLDTSSFEASVSKARKSLEDMLGGVKIDPLGAFGSSIHSNGGELQQQLNTARQAMEGIKQSGGGLSSIFGNLNTSSLMLSAGLSVLGLELKALSDRYTETMNAAQRYRQDQAGEAARAAAYTMGLSGTQTSNTLNMVRNAPNLIDVSHLMGNIAGREQMESGLRAYESTNANPRFKAARREFEEFALPRQQFLERSGEHIERAEGNLDRLNLELQRIQMARRNREGQFRNETLSRQSVIEHAMDETAPGFLMRQIRKPLANMGLLGGHNLDTGMYDTQHVAQQEAIKQQAEARVKYQEDLVKLKKEEEDVTREIAAQQQKIADEQKQQVTTTLELRQKAYELLHAEEERVRSANISFGSAPVAQQIMALRVQEKTERNEARRAKNREAGRPENEGIERLNQFEMGSNLFGGIGERERRIQGEMIANEKGFKTENNLDELKENVDKQEKFPLAATKSGLTETIEDIKQTGSEILQLLGDTSGLLAFMNSVKRELQERDAILKNFQLKAQGR